MNRHRAFTLVELLIALSITVLIGGTVVAMIMSVSQGTRASQNGRDHFVRGQMLQNRLREIIERSHGVLAVTSTSILFWFDDIPGPNGTSDSNGDPLTAPSKLDDRFLVNRNELVLVEWDSTSRQVRMYFTKVTPIENPPGASDDPGSAYPANWNSATYMAEAQKIKGQITGLSEMDVLGTNVTSFSIAAYPATEPLSSVTYVNASAVIGSDANTRTVAVGAMLRQRMTPK